MRIRILDRILVALAGLILVAFCAGLVAQVFFGVDVIGFVSNHITTETTAQKIMIGAAAAILLILGLYCLLILFRHRKRKDRFVLQKLESGDLAISLKTVETMVRKCLDQHNEIKTDSIRLENQRDGLLIRVRGTVAGGISIPLTVDTLQKQVKRYVTACSGIEVKGIRIQIESSGEDAKDALFAIDPPANNLLPRGGEPSNETPSPAQPAGEGSTEQHPDNHAETEKNAASEETAAAAAMAAAESLMNEVEIEDDRPIHQKLFSTQEEPCIMPLPPENLENAEAVNEQPLDPAEPEKESEPDKTGESREPADSPETEKQDNTETAGGDETKGEENA